MIGDGSLTNPYVVRSTRGFLWLTNYSLSKKVLYKKHIELECDVILNDETFDQDGKPSGGDGIVYSMTRITGQNTYYINGNNHTISGLYINAPAEKNVDLFYVALEVKNICFDNVFLLGAQSVALITRVSYLENVIFKSGTIVAIEKGNYCAGIAQVLDISAKDCVNAANVISKATAGGIAGQVTGDGYIYRCKNYGYITGESCSSGIIGLAKDITIENCVNYGKIDVRTYFSAGIVGVVTSGTNVVNCDNYGEISVYEYKDGECSGIVGRVSASVLIKDCNNYAKVYNKVSAKTSAEIVGYIQPPSSISNLHIQVIGCNGFYGNARFVGSQHAMGFPDTNLIVDKCVFVSKAKTSYLIGWYDRETIAITIKNTKILLEGETCYITSTTSRTKVKVSSLLIEGICNNAIFASVATWDIGSIIQDTVNNSGKATKTFYGADFSGFYTDWKTGKIGLKAFSGKGVYQGRLTEEVLINKGFEKKVI